MAAAIGVSVRTISNWETGASVPRNRLGALEELLHERFDGSGTVGPPAQDAEPGLPVGSGVDPIDLAELHPDDAAWMRSQYERLRQQRGE